MYEKCFIDPKVNLNVVITHNIQLSLESLHLVIMAVARRVRDQKTENTWCFITLLNRTLRIFHYHLLSVEALVVPRIESAFFTNLLSFLSGQLQQYCTVCTVRCRSLHCCHFKCGLLSRWRPKYSPPKPQLHLPLWKECFTLARSSFLLRCCYLLSFVYIQHNR